MDNDIIYLVLVMMKLYWPLLTTLYITISFTTAAITTNSTHVAISYFAT